MKQLKKPLRWMKQELAEQGKDWRQYGLERQAPDGSSAVLVRKDNPAIQIVVENHGWKG